MKGDPKVIKVLNDVLRKELTGINQYYASRELLEHIVVDEERHVDWIEAQLHKIEEVGYQNYLAQQIYKKS